MSDEVKKIKTALVSVYHKDGLDEIIKLLHADGVRFLSTGGTRSFIEGLGIPCDAVEDLTGYPSILGGRVKTLHPKVFGGILSRRDMAGDREQTTTYEIPEIDLVIVDLYPFEDTVASGASAEDIIEKIDIGGISLIRAAAKNYKDVVIVASKSQYTPLLEILKRKGANTTLNERRDFARQAFGVSSHYDSAIFNWFDATTEPTPTALRVTANGSKPMRYGENPHQKGYFFGDFDAMFSQIHGKEISYNNLLDIDAAVALISDFQDKPTVAVLKHNNACGCAERETLSEAWEAALAGDPVSAFGGIIVTNREIDATTAEGMDKIFFEVVIAPSYTEEALEVLRHKKNRIILVQKQTLGTGTQVRSCLNGYLVQERDTKSETKADMRQVSKKALSDTEISDLIFAVKLVKHSKSNAIVLAKDGQLLASGVGQTSRVDALKHAIAKAGSFGFNLEGAVMASDAFFPFPDCVQIAGEAGIKAVVHPGGSIRDQESIDWCDNNDIAMAMTGFRHFRH